MGSEPTATETFQKVGLTEVPAVELEPVGKSDVGVTAVFFDPTATGMLPKAGLTEVPAAEGEPVGNDGGVGFQDHAGKGGGKNTKPAKTSGKSGGKKTKSAKTSTTGKRVQSLLRSYP